MTLAPIEISEDDREAILRVLKLDSRKPETKAVLLICQKYDLDPILKHVILIEGKPYVTRDGYLHIAHNSGQFDGIEIINEGDEESTTNRVGYWWAVAKVYRKDMAHPFTYRGRYSHKGSNARYGPEMAIKTAEAMAMRRAFDVTGLGAADEKWDTNIDTEAIGPQVAAELTQRLNDLGGDARADFYNHFGQRKPQQLGVTDEADAIDYVTKLEMERPFVDENGEKVSPAGGDVAPVEPAGDQPPEKLL